MIQKKDVISLLQERDIIDWTVKDLSPAEVPVTHSFELENETSTALCSELPPAHNEPVHTDVQNYLQAGIITPFTPAWFFHVVTASKRMGLRVFLSTIEN